MTDASSIIEDEKNNPHISKGMLVDIWNVDDVTNPIFFAVGRVLKMEWSYYYQQYICDVEAIWKGVVEKYTVFAGQCDQHIGRALLTVIK